jgi:putative membrane protein
MAACQPPVRVASHARRDEKRGAWTADCSQGEKSRVLAKTLAYVIGSIVAVLAVGTIFPSGMVSYDDQESVVIFGVALGLLTSFVKPVLSLLTLPISCLTFGLFSIVLNAALFGLAASLSPDVTVSIPGALVGGVFAAIINGVMYSVADDRK